LITLPGGAVYAGCSPAGACDGGENARGAEREREHACSAANCGEGEGLGEQHLVTFDHVRHARARIVWRVARPPLQRGQERAAIGGDCAAELHPPRPAPERDGERDHCKRAERGGAARQSGDARQNGWTT
jgi:hypothetical protein